MPTVTLRTPVAADLDFLYRLECLPDVRRVSLGDARVTRHMLWRYITEASGDLVADGQLRLVIADVAGVSSADSGVAVGTIDLSDYDPRNARAMVGVAIDPACRRAGYARAAIDALVARCASLPLCELCAMVAADNAASLALFTSCGFAAIATLPGWLRRPRLSDVVILRLTLQ